MALVGTQNEACRVKWVENSLRNLPEGSRILDAGAGEQQFRKFCGHLKYVSQDIAQYDGKGDQSGLQMGKWEFKNLDHVCDITKIPEPDASFDAILCTEVFEHLPDAIAAIREFSRLVRPGGHVIITAPFCSITHFAPYHFSTGFSRFFYQHHLSLHGFEILELQTNGGFFDYLAQELRRLDEVARRYTSLTKKFRTFDRIVVKLGLRVLDRLARADRGSSELLTFGYHVRAVKK